MMTNGTIGVETRNAIPNIEMALMRKYFLTVENSELK